MKNKLILIINGPNLNLLGEREVEVYGTLTLKKMNYEIKKYGSKKNVDLVFYQSNHEGEIIDFLHRFRKKANGVVLNPAALTHYSYAIRDAVSSISIPCVEVHLSDIKKRESFRKKSVIADVCIGQISGQGMSSYLKGIDLLLKKII